MDHLNERLRGHIRKSVRDCPLAFKLAREATGKTETSYSGDDIREKLQSDPGFFSSYQHAKAQIKRMKIRWVHEPDPTRQALLEIQVSVVLDTLNSAFNTKYAELAYPEIIVYSANLKKPMGFVETGSWSELSKWLLDIIYSLHRAGAEFAVIASNTPHIVFDEVKLIH